MLTHKEIVHALGHIRPNSEWTLNDTGLIWLDSSPRPTRDEINDACHACNPLKKEWAKLRTDSEKITFLASIMGFKQGE